MARIGRLGGTPVDVVVDRAEIKEWLRTDRDLGSDLDRRATRVLRAARRNVGKDTGTLAASGRKQPGVRATGQYVDVIFGIPGRTHYNMYHHDGTPPHVIRPRRKKALRYMVGGRVVFARRVNHPGTRGTRYLERALDAAR